MENQSVAIRNDNRPFILPDEGAASQSPARASTIGDVTYNLAEMKKAIELAELYPEPKTETKPDDE
jgi:hypothetical protein